MTGTEIAGFIASHGIWVLLPLSVAEGPVVSLGAGVLAVQGLLDPAATLIALVAGDLIGDCLLYAIGRGGSRGLQRLLPLRLRPSRRRVALLVRGFRRGGWRILVAGKLTHAAGFAVLVAAGAARMPPGAFLLANLAAAIPKAAALMAAGALVGSVPGWSDLWPGLWPMLAGAGVLAAVSYAVWLAARRGGGLRA